MARDFEIVVSHNVRGLEQSFGGAVSGIQRYDRSKTATGDIVSLWTGRGTSRESRGGMAASWRISRARMFRSQGSSTGTPWVDYTDSERQYAAIKSSIFRRRVGRSQGDLNRWLRGNERLVPSFVSRYHRENVERTGRQFMIVGSAVPYAGRLHTGGGRIPRRLGGGTSPARPLLGFGSQLLRDWDADLLAFVRAHTASIGKRMTREQILERAR